MKKTIQDGTGKITGTEFYCDNPKHKNIKARGQSLVHFWYGSCFDLQQSQVHLCDECAKEILVYLKQKFGKSAELSPVIEL